MYCFGVGVRSCGKEAYGDFVSSLGDELSDSRNDSFPVEGVADIEDSRSWVSKLNVLLGRLVSLADESKHFEVVASNGLVSDGLFTVGASIPRSKILTVSRPTLLRSSCAAVNHSEGSVDNCQREHGWRKQELSFV
jgi:hypothetical protein